MLLRTVSLVIMRSDRGGFLAAARFRSGCARFGAINRPYAWIMGRRDQRADHSKQGLMLRRAFVTGQKGH
jgi:hypothetical protein